MDLVKQPIKLSLVVAMNNKTRGIGVNGTIPWRIPADLKHFAKVTTLTTDPNKINVVLMGRLTWFSIPKNFRPLPNRLNVIISSTMENVEASEPKENADISKILIFKSFEEAIEILVNQFSDSIENIYAIGGTQIFKRALEYPIGFLHRIYLTRVYSETKCDVFMEPENFLDYFKKLEVISDKENFNVEFNRMITEPSNKLDYCFEVYEKIK